jgi:hypothetical protein
VSDGVSRRRGYRDGCDGRRRRCSYGVQRRDAAAGRDGGIGVGGTHARGFDSACVMGASVAWVRPRIEDA